MLSYPRSSSELTLLTIEEAARFLRLSKRTMYLRKDIPRVREGHRVLFLKEDLEAWILAHREGGKATGPPEASPRPLDGTDQPCHHRSPALRTLQPKKEVP